MQHEIDSETGEVIESGGYRRSAQFKELMIAMAAAQAEFENVEKAGENEAFKRGGRPSRYVTLGAVIEEIRPKLASHGLAMCQMPINGAGNNIGVTTLVVHGASGQWIDSTLFAAPTKVDAQGVGSVITYLRRYGAMAMVMLAPEDDDGNAASVAAPQTQGRGQLQERLRQDLRGNGTSAPQPPARTSAEARFNEIKREIDAAQTFDELNATGLYGPTCEADKEQLDAVKFKSLRGGTETAWSRLVDRDASRRMIIAGAEGDIVA